MAKKKTIAVSVEETPTVAKRGNKGGSVLIAKTATELGELLGYDVPVLVSKKSIIDVQAKNVRSELAANLG